MPSLESRVINEFSKTIPWQNYIGRGKHKQKERLFHLRPKINAKATARQLKIITSPKNIPEYIETKVGKVNSICIKIQSIKIRTR